MFQGSLVVQLPVTIHVSGYSLCPTTSQLPMFQGSLLAQLPANYLCIWVVCQLNYQPTIYVSGQSVSSTTSQLYVSGQSVSSTTCQLSMFQGSLLVQLPVNYLCFRVVCQPNYQLTNHVSGQSVSPTTSQLSNSGKTILQSSISSLLYQRRQGQFKFRIYVMFSLFLEILATAVGFLHKKCEQVDVGGTLKKYKS